jgi:hypothetical protein
MIAQQLSWLAAAFQEKKDSLTYAYVGFSEATQLAADLGVPTFNIEVQLEVLPENEKSKMCWNSIIGPGVIIRGFPLPERKHKERGLEASIRVMAQLLDLHKAVTFKGGYVFKGRYTALIPVQTFGNSIQWHIVDAYPRKLEWTDIDALCPIRLIRYTIASFLDTRSFIGWCPIVLETLGSFRFISVLPLLLTFTHSNMRLRIRSSPLFPSKRATSMGSSRKISAWLQSMGYSYGRSHCRKEGRILLPTTGRLRCSSRRC